MGDMGRSVKDYYKILGVEENVDLKTLKKKYRKLAQQYHPDRNDGDAAAEEKFKEISEAYSTLSDTDQRSKYDMMRKGGGIPFGGGGFHDIFNSFFGGNMNAFGGNPFHQQQARQQRRNEDPLINLKIPLSELTQGKLTKTFRVKRHVDCMMCHGKGGKSVERCTVCNGLGKLYESRQHGGMVFQNVTACGQCQGRGKIIDNPCISCNAERYNTSDNNL